MTAHFDGLSMSQPLNLERNGTAVSLLFGRTMMQLIFRPDDGRITFIVCDRECNLWHVPPEFSALRGARVHVFRSGNLRLRVTRKDGRFQMTVRSTQRLASLKRFFVLTLQKIQDETDSD